MSSHQPGSGSSRHFSTSTSPSALEPYLSGLAPTRSLQSNEPHGYSPQVLPRRSRSERVTPHHPSYQPNRGHDPPPLPPPDMSSEARRQSLIAMDRKRRLTGSAHETGRRRTTTGGFTSRDNQYYATNSRMPPPDPESPPAGAAQREVIDLTSSSPTRPPLPSSSAQRTSSNSSRSYVPPRWQPDSEVAECPCCHRSFSWYFRKHHCRKCGRVICNDCSPHRIQIPRQYIVHPPGTEEEPATPAGVLTVDLTRSEDEGGRYAGFGSVINRQHPALGGGEKVRLCNPCVPDPQPEHLSLFDRSPPQRPQFTGRPGDTMRPPRLTSFPQLPPYPSSQAYPGSQDQSSSLPHPGTRIHVDVDDEESGSLAEAYMSAPRRQIMGIPSNRYPAQAPQHSRYRSLDAHRGPLQPFPPFANRPRMSSVLDSPARYYGPDRHPHTQTVRYGNSGPEITTTAPRPPRPRIREEDMCPICRGMLPLQGPDGDETAREAHIMGCISQHDPSARATATSAPNQIPQGLSTSLPAATLMNLVSPPSSSTPPYPQRAMPMQMVRFTATEKDCIATAQPTEAGGTEVQPQECSICMVEYDVGDRLARLECWCKFHVECIVEWFGRKRECPVHKLG